ncbi:MAG: hypothetical protein KR126chlam3_00340, partial [Chlamydiae bacterium]|nr:hypothetical protein [Chlamydiota bacterium]
MLDFCLKSAILKGREKETNLNCALFI